ARRFRWCVHPKTGEKWWNEAELLSCSMCSRTKGVAFGGNTAPALPSMHAKQLPPKPKDTDPKKELRAKDLEIIRLKAQLQAAGAGTAASQEPLVSEPTNLEQRGLGEIATALKALGPLEDAAAVRARDELARERDELKGRIVASKPFSSQLTSHQADKGTLELLIGETASELAKLEQEIIDLEAQRVQVALKAPTVAAGSFSLKTMVPAPELPVDRFGEMLRELGADATLTASVSTCFEALRELQAEATAQAAAASSSSEAPPPGQQPGQAPEAERQAQQQDAAAAVPMDTDDIEELRSYLTAIGIEPPAEEAEVRERVKRMAEAANDYAK
ncbi:unnamed protein product, partial [Prorocentrum cordatum]